MNQRMAHRKLRWALVGVVGAGTAASVAMTTVSLAGLAGRPGVGSRVAQPVHASMAHSSIAQPFRVSSASPGPVTRAKAPPHPNPNPNPVASGPAVHVAGNHLVDAAGATVHLQGVNVSGTEFACDQGGDPASRGWSIYGNQPLDDPATFEAMVAWHIQVVRVPLNEDCWLGINGVNPDYAAGNYQAAIATEVGLIHRAGMDAVLDLHWSAPGAYAAIAQQPMADADHSVTFWKSVATAYRNDRAVIFDLYNEPFLYGSYLTSPSQDSWACWLNGCSLKQFVSAGQMGPDGATLGYTTAITWRTAGMQTMIDAIRGTGATQPVLVNGLDWSNDASGWLAHRPSDPAGQMIAGVHLYPGETCSDTACWDSVFGAIASQYPVLVGETGDATSGAPTFLPAFLSYADAHGWSYLAWTWNPWGDPSNVLVTDWSGTPTPGEGSYFRRHLLVTG